MNNTFTIQETTKNIDYFVRGWEADNDKKEGFVKSVNTFNQISASLTHYINELTPPKHNKTEQEVINELTKQYN